MPQLQVSINGKKVATAGVGEFGVVSTMVSWVRRKGENTSTGKPDSARGNLRFHLGGLDTGKDPHENITWTNRNLKAGDEVMIRIVRNALVDRPRHRRRSASAKEDLRAQKRYVRMMAKKLGWKIETR